MDNEEDCYEDRVREICTNCIIGLNDIRDIVYKINNLMFMSDDKDVNAKLVRTYAEKFIPIARWSISDLESSLNSIEIGIKSEEKQQGN